MSKGFNALKKRIIKEHLIKTSIVGISIGLSIFGVLFLLIKREIIELNIAFMILISVAGLAGSASLYYFITKPNERSIAYRLDHTFGLNEKVQTMIDYKDVDDNYIVQVQRENTNYLLDHIKPKNLKLYFPFIFIIMLLIGASLSITSIAVPKIVHNIPVDPIDPPIEVSESDIEKIRKIIKHVEESNIFEDMKPKYIAELNILIVELQSSNLTSDKLKSYVEGTINNVLLLMNEKNANKGYGKSLYLTEKVKYKPTIASVGDDSFNPTFIGKWESNDGKKELRITKNKISYNNKDFEISSYTNKTLVLKDESSTQLLLTDEGKIQIDNETYEKVEAYYRVKALGNGLYDYSLTAIETVINNITEEYSNLSKDSIVLLKDKLALDIEVYSGIVSEEKEDILYPLFKELSDSLVGASDVSDSKKLNVINTAFDKLYLSLANIIPELEDNKNEAFYIEDTLREIFDLAPANRNDKLDDGQASGSDVEGDSNKDLSSGGKGDGKYIYAAEDYFFDNDSGKWMAYGVFYTDYYNEIDALLQDGTISEETAQYVKDYFNKLINGLNKDSD